MQDIIAFENANPKEPQVLTKFTQTLFDIRERHANTVPNMAEAVMEVKSNDSGTGSNKCYSAAFQLLYKLNTKYKPGPTSSEGRAMAL